MKMRYDFVTNSSSVSYLIAVKEKELTVSQSMIFKNFMKLRDDDCGDTECGKKIEDENLFNYYKETMTDKEKFKSEDLDTTWNYYIKDIAYKSPEIYEVFKSFDKDKVKVFILYN